jgi:hypothetical protein
MTDRLMCGFDQIFEWFSRADFAHEPKETVMMLEDFERASA